MQTRRIVSVALVGLALSGSALVPIASSAESPLGAPGCTAVAPSSSAVTCVYVSGGGRVLIAAATTDWWAVAWSHEGAFVYCGSGAGPGAVRVCNIPKGAEVHVGARKGVTTVRDLPNRL